MLEIEIIEIEIKRNFEVKLILKIITYPERERDGEISRKEIVVTGWEVRVNLIFLLHV